jgi:rhodanese-related sulfurtransferase
MTTSDLNKRLGDTGLVVLDVRSPGDWQASELMVSGAIRKSPGAALAWAGEVDKGKTVVLYCA